MKKILISIVFTGICSLLISQDLVIDEQGFETFEMTDGDTTHTMKKYFMVFLKKGPKRDQNQEDVAIIQKGHMAHMTDMANKKQISIAGPFGDDGDIQGIVIFNVPTQEEVEALVAKDPAVTAGRLLMEIHPWWASQGSTLD